MWSFTKPFAQPFNSLFASGEAVTLTSKKQYTVKTTSTYEGTQYDDLVTLYENDAMTVNTYGGNDIVKLYGFGDYTVNTGADADHVHILGTGTVNANSGGGNDTFFVKEIGSHVLDGGQGPDDTVSFNGLTKGVIADLTSGKAYFAGSGAEKVTMRGIESLWGSAHDDMLRGNDGANVLFGGGGHDQIFGEGGDDTIHAGNGDDFVAGGAGDDDIDLSGGNDTVFGGAGDDKIVSVSGFNEIHAGSGADEVYGGSDDDIIHGGDADDQSNDHFSGGLGSDTLDYSDAAGGGFFDMKLGKVTGTAAGKTLVETDGNMVTYTVFKDTFDGFEVVHGTAFNDTFRGTDSMHERDKMYGGAGDDRFIATWGDDIYNGGWDQHRYGEGDEDFGVDIVDYSHLDGTISVNLNAGKGHFEWQGFWANWIPEFTDTYHEIDGIVGTDNNDTFVGNHFDNVFEGGGGYDVATGNGGSDTFVFRNSGDYAYDTITDFTSGEDVLELVGMKLNTGERVDDFSVLDSNDDGVIDRQDDAMFTAGDNGYLMLQNQIIHMQQVSELQSDDFLLA